MNEVQTTYVWRGVDISYINEMEDCGAVYRVDGEIRDPYRTFADKGANLARFRLWHDPDWTDYSTLPDVMESIRRAKDNGMRVLLDFHYSDDWADPQNQRIPAAWRQAESIEEIAELLYDYTYTTLMTLHEQGLLPHYVQVGNEINHGVARADPRLDAWGENPARNVKLLNAGIMAVRDVGAQTGQPLEVMLHIAGPGSVERWLDTAMREGLADFDIIGISYYSQWSGMRLDQVANSIKRLHSKYGKEVVIAEAAYPWTLTSNDSANNILDEDSVVEGYSATQAGQRQYLIDLMQEVLNGGGLGIIYWEPAWISTGCSTRWGTGSHWENAALFDYENSELHEGADFLSYEYTEPLAQTRATEEGVLQDAAADTGTAYTMSAGGTFGGIFNNKFDKDWIRINLVQGETYEINLAGAGTNSGADTILRIFNSAGEQVAYNDDADLATGKLNSTVTYSPDTTGSYFISAGTYGANPNKDYSGPYMVTVIGGRDNNELQEETAYELVSGSDLDDILVGSPARERLEGRGGSDRLNGGSGDDELDGGAGNDWLIGGEGADKLTGGSGEDFALYRHSGAGVTVRLHAVLTEGGKGGHAEEDTYIGTETVAYTDAGGNTLTLTVPDIEHLVGSEHNDILAGDGRDNWLDGGGGDDRLYGGPDGGDDVLAGGEGDDRLYGGKGDDTLEGGPGNDQLSGGPDNDRLDGGSDNDRLDGGEGDDIFYFKPGDGHDTILDFGNGADKIDLTAFEDIRAIADLGTQQQSGAVVIDLSGQGGGTLTLEDFNAADIMDEHFVFFTDDAM